MAAGMYEFKQRLEAILREDVPLMPSDMLRDFVAGYFARRDAYLAAAIRHGSPLYLQELEVVRTQADAFKKAFQRHLSSTAFYYAVKSNNHPAIARVVLEKGYGLDVSSGRELEFALELASQDIIFSGPGKTDAELNLAVTHNELVTVLIDSMGELHRLGTIAEKAGKQVRCGVRLCLNTTGLWRKFGIPLEMLRDFWEAAGRYPHIRLSGLQFHSSWNLTPETQVTYIQRLGKAIRDLPSEIRHRIEFIDVGGGYWPERGEWLRPAATPKGAIHEVMGEPPGPPDHHHLLTAVPADAFARAISEALRQHVFSHLAAVPCKVFLEPGRWICNDAVALIITVVDKKDAALVITDAGTNAVGWERYESDYFPVLNLTRPSLNENRCDILGSLCTPHDVWGAHYFGTGIEPGDVLMIPTQGAYTYSLRQNFIKPLPKVVAI